MNQMNFIRSVFAEILRVIIKIPYVGEKFWGICCKKIISLNLFKNVTKKVKIGDNILLELNISDWIQMNLFFVGAYEMAELQFAKKTIPKEGCFIDIGANIGLYSLIIAKSVGEKGKVIAFEPFSTNYRSLLKNISLNSITNIIVEQQAISDDNKQIELYYDQFDNNLGMTSSYKSKYSHKEIVDAVSIDNYLEKHHIDNIHLIKIDIEGGELLALSGMKKTLIRYEPVLIIEVDENILASTPYKKQDILEFLAYLNYDMYYIDNNGNISTNEINKKRKNLAFIKAEKK